MNVRERYEMKFFLDTAEIKEIEKWDKTGLVDGITTNPSLILQSGKDIKSVLGHICEIMGERPVSGEVVAIDSDRMVGEGKILAKIADNICIKLPTTVAGLTACHQLTSEGFQTNMTLCFSANQALLAAKAGATFISPFVGRLDDMGIEGMALIEEIRMIYDNYGFGTEILAASVRSVNHVKDCALAGADVATLPAAIFDKLAAHPLTDKGLQQFLDDWEKTGQKI